MLGRRVPMILQSEAPECGIAVVAMMPTPIKALAHFSPSTSTTASAVLTAGRLYSGRGYSMRIERVLTSHGRYCLPFGVS